MLRVISADAFEVVGARSVRCVGVAGEHGGMALPRHDAVNERTCRRATVTYGLLMLQKQYSSMPPEARKCSLSTMWL